MDGVRCVFAGRFGWACWVKIVSGTSQLSGCRTCVREGVSNGVLVRRGWRWVGTELLGSINVIQHVVDADWVG